MVILNFNPVESFENPEFGEINNYCMEEYDQSLDSYFQVYSTFQEDTILNNFGEIEFAEIKSKHLKEFEQGLKNYFQIN